MQKKGSASYEELEWQDSFLSNNDASFPNDPTGELPNSWGAAEDSFQIRGANYLKDRKKVNIIGYYFFNICNRFITILSFFQGCGKRHIDATCCSKHAEIEQQTR